MSGESTRKRVQAVLFAAIMVVSMVAAGVGGFAGSAAAEVSSIDGVSAENVTAGSASETQNVTLVGVNRTNSDTSNIEVEFSNVPNTSVVSASATDTGSFDGSNVTASKLSESNFSVQIDGNQTVTSNITVEVTLNTSDADTGTKFITVNPGEPVSVSAEDSFEILSDNNGGDQTDDKLLVDPDEDGAYDTIQVAINEAESGDRIEIMSGNYTNFIANTSNITVAGNGNAIVKSSQVDITAENVTLQGLNFTGDYSNWTGDDRFRPEHVDNPPGSVYYPIIWVNADNAEVSRVNISVASDQNLSPAVNGAVISGDSEFTHSKINYPENTFTGAPLLEFVSGSNVTISNNEFSQNIGGFVGESSQSVTVQNNEFTGQTRNLVFTGSGFGAIPDGAEITVENNNLPIKVDTQDHTNGWYFAGDSIQSGIDNLAEGGSLEVPPGVYNESLTINTPNVTLESTAGADSTTIRLDEESTSATIDINASDVTVDGFRVERTNGKRYSQAISIRATDGVTVANNTLVGGESTSNPTQGVLITDNRGDQEANTDTTIGNNNTIEGFDHGVAISTQDTGGISGAKIESNTIRNNVIGVKFSDFDETGEDIDASISGNDITGNDYGVYVLNSSEGPAGTNPKAPVDLTGSGDDIEITGNNFLNNENSSITSLAEGENEIDARFNFFGDSLSIRESGVNLVFDPVLTTPIENVSAESARETTEYGSLLELQSDGSDSLAIGFPAPSEASIGELLSDVEFDNGAQAYRYDIDDGFVPVSGDYTPNASDVVVIAKNDDISQGIIVPVDAAETNTSAPGAVRVNGGWNLVPTGATNDIDSLTVREGNILENKTLQDQPEQPGTPDVAESGAGAYDGTWVFVERDFDGANVEFLTGYETGQTASEYSEEILTPESLESDLRIVEEEDNPE